MGTEKKICSENLAVYETLRNSIISCEERIANETIYMYVTYFALFAFGFEHSWLFLVSFIALVVFQSLINSDRLAIEKASSYIRIFFEEVRGDINWECFNKDLAFVRNYSKRVQDAGWFIFKYSSSILAVISVGAIFYTVAKKYGYQVLLMPDIVEGSVALVLCCFVFHINKKIYVNHGDDDIELVGDIRRFYDMLYARPKEQNNSPLSAELLKQAKNDFKTLYNVPEMPEEALKVLQKWINDDYDKVQDG